MSLFSVGVGQNSSLIKQSSAEGFMLLMRWFQSLVIIMGVPTIMVAAVTVSDLELKHEKLFGNAYYANVVVIHMRKKLSFYGSTNSPL